MDFQQAEAQFRWLEDQLRTGAMTEQQYQAGLMQIQVTDAWGRRWMKQQHSGQWHVLVNNQWMPSQPPPVAAPTAPPAYPQPPAQTPAYPQALTASTPGYPPLGQVYPQPPAYPRPQVAAAPIAAPVYAQAQQGLPAQKEPGLFFKYARMFFIFVIVWAIIGVLVYLFVAPGQVEVLFGVALAALLSFVITVRQMGGSWRGQIIDIRTVEEDDGDEGTENVTYTFIRETNGRVRKEKGALPGWQVGDWVEKRQGENWYRKVK